MAIGPNDCVEPIRSDVVSHAESYLDTKLNNFQWKKDWRCGDLNSPFWEVIIPFELTTPEREHIIKIYKDAGWSSVTLRNSSDNDERAGLCGAIFFK